MAHTAHLELIEVSQPPVRGIPGTSRGRECITIEEARNGTWLGLDAEECYMGHCS